MIRNSNIHKQLDQEWTTVMRKNIICHGVARWIPNSLAVSVSGLRASSLSSPLLDRLSRCPANPLCQFFIHIEPGR